ncbi:MAG: hypothetical protein ABIF18_01570 [archaeon]
MVSLKLEVKKKDLTWLMPLVAVLVVGVVYAYTIDGSGNPSVMGHSAGELEITDAFCNSITGHDCGVDVSASTECTGTDVYLDGEGNCDSIVVGGGWVSVFSSSTATSIPSFRATYGNGYYMIRNGNALNQWIHFIYINTFSDSSSYLYSQDKSAGTGPYWRIATDTLYSNGGYIYQIWEWQ